MPLSLPYKGTYRLGVIADTHGYLPPRALDVFERVDAILHAGDIGSQEILQVLAQIAPVLAVRGNMDGGYWADDLPEHELLEAADKRILVIHDRLRLRPQKALESCLAVVNGHTHRPLVEKKNNLLYVNPGSAGAPRWGEQSSVALMHLKGNAATVKIIPIDD